MSYPENFILEENVNGMNLNLVGVTHTRNFFQEHEDFFRKQISDSSSIFIENGPEVLTHEFYGEIAKIARETNKPIYIPGPSTDASYLMLDFLQLGIGIYLAESYLRKPKKMTRRDFLKKGGKTIFGLYLTLGSLGPRNYLEKIIGNKNVKLNNALQYNTVLDYRNIVVAENLDRASRVLRFEGQIPYFIGSRHVEGIHTYLQNPKLREKRLIYLPQDLISDTSFRKYEFQEGKWKLTESI